MEQPTALDLYKRVALLGKIADRKALSNNYRVIALTAQDARAASPYGVMRCAFDLDLDLDGLDNEICVDAEKFVGVLHNIADTDFTVRLTEHSLSWQCGGAKGRLPFIEAAVPTPHFTGKMTQLGGSFSTGLTLGALGCGYSAFLRNAGLESVQLLNRNGQAYAMASDSAMISSCRLGPALTPGKIATLRPEAAALLAEVTDKAEDIWLGVDDHSVYCLTPHLELQLYQLMTRHSTNLADKIEPFMEHRLTRPLYKEPVAAFLKRVSSHAEIKQQALVTVAVDDGVTVLGFTEADGDTEEEYSIGVMDGERITVPPIRIEARRLAKALAHANELVFDYHEKNVLVLRGPNDFVFGIVGQ